MESGSQAGEGPLRGAVSRRRKVPAVSADPVGEVVEAAISHIQAQQDRLLEEQRRILEHQRVDLEGAIAASKRALLVNDGGGSDPRRDGRSTSVLFRIKQWSWRRRERAWRHAEVTRTSAPEPRRGGARRSSTDPSGGASDCRG
jgi:hypothetical protein